MESSRSSRPSHDDTLQSESADRVVKTESATGSPRHSFTDMTFKLSPTPVPSTEASDIGAATPSGPPRKKGVASVAKKAIKRPKNGPIKKAKRSKSEALTSGVDDSGGEQSDNGPYCLCRGPDDHRWMICCEKCEDWYHGECIKMNKEIGENLIEKFVCPLCSTGGLSTIYKKTCALGACKKAARLTQSPPSVFCSNEHAQAWWERMVSRLPKAKAKKGLDDQLTQDEFMAILGSELSGVDENGAWRLAKAPFSDSTSRKVGTNGDELSHILSDEERKYLDEAAAARRELSEETALCGKMFTLIELAQQRRRAAITAGHFGEDICGYDNRLDTIASRDVFAAFAASPEGEAVLANSKLDDPLGEGDPVRGMCERKRCKAHSGWQKMLPLGLKHQIREMAGQTAEREEEERILRDAAVERWKRLKAERNWVEALDG